MQQLTTFNDSAAHGRTLPRAAACVVVFTVGLVAIGPSRAAAEDFAEEFRVKREEVFEFTEPPTIRAAGDQVEISFSSKAHCDVTVAIEDAQGRIVRHLACGLLGAGAGPAGGRLVAAAARLGWQRRRRAVCR